MQASSSSHGVASQQIRRSLQPLRPTVSGAPIYVPVAAKHNPEDYGVQGAASEGGDKASEGGDKSGAGLLTSKMAEHG
jgi:hypothetical protein